MGRPKGLLVLEGGDSFARRVVTSLLAGGCDPVCFVTRPGEAELAGQAREAGARVLENDAPGEGPITSLRLALHALAAVPLDYVAYLPVDHPRVRPETIARLIGAAAEGAHAGADGPESPRLRRASDDGRVWPPVVLPTHAGKRGHPVLLARGLFPELLDPALEGGARTVVHRHLARARTVEVDDPGVLVDVDTPAEYEELLGGVEPSERNAT